MILDSGNFKHYVDRFNADDVEDVANLIPNSGAWNWMTGNIPLFTCPDSEIEEIYYYRWWTFRKHIKQTPIGRVITEFILPVKHAGAYNTVSCALGHHIAEGRWLRDTRLLDEWIGFWFRGNDGKPQPHFHKYSQWVAAAVLARAHVTGEMSFPIELLDDLVSDYRAWEAEKLLPTGLFWQYDVWDGMEESISGSRTHKNIRPTINSYMYGNALAISEIAHKAGRMDLAVEYAAKGRTLLERVKAKLWDPAAQFFKVMFEDGALSDAREAIGFLPWAFNVHQLGFEQAWEQLIDPRGFWAPFGITTAERRHPQFRSHGVGHCEWDGAVWPFATSQTLVALANVLRYYPEAPVTRSHYLQAMKTYAESHRMHGQPYIGEYLDETTGEWLKGDNPRSRYYNHSTFADLVITGLVGLMPTDGDEVLIDPFLPSDAWDWFCLDDVHYHGKRLTILWDRNGERFGHGAGLSLWTDGDKKTLRPYLGRRS